VVRSLQEARRHGDEPDPQDILKAVLRHYTRNPSPNQGHRYRDNQENRSKTVVHEACCGVGVQTAVEPEDLGHQPVPMATSGGRPNARMNSGEKKVAPSTPEAMAVVAINTAAGSMYQNSRLTTAGLRLQAGPDGCGFSRRKPLLPGRVVGQPVQGDSGGPRLVGGAEKLAGKGVEDRGRLIVSRTPSTGRLE
jgi:hypothetical protein